MDLQSLDDNKLVEKAKNNPDAFAYIINKYNGPLSRFIKRISYFRHEDIEDILQDVFIKVYKSLNAYDPKLKFSSWLYQICRNQTIDQIRKNKARVTMIQLDSEDIAKMFSSDTDLKKELELKDELQKVKSAISELPFKYREVLILKFIEEMNYNEIIDVIKKPKGTVATLINRGKKMLVKKLKHSKKTSK
ncbi:MAG: sigma-70 family RNA polymerase sigma factor [Candidatus Moranbacteria bacterium]|nr:sigma-70 family RNA polymerase sigma factor [Candidatus Moranbacteria bacterium]